MNIPVPPQDGYKAPLIKLQELIPIASTSQYRDWWHFELPSL